jgi:hypothetical protein
MPIAGAMPTVTAMIVCAAPSLRAMLVEPADSGIIVKLLPETVAVMTFEL